MTRMTLIVALLALFTAGCYTKLYRPGDAPMGQTGPYDRLYNRYDSTAIDTTLTQPEYEDTYTEDYGWSYWGRHRYPRWGFDFWNFSPDYYWSYYGYYDYYSVPWWQRYYDPWYYWGWTPPSGTSEPPAQREYGRRGRPTEGSGPYAAPPPGGGGSYAQPQPQTPAQKPDDSRKQQQPPKPEDTNKREGRRGR